MSAFAGFLRLDQQNASAATVEAMLERLRHRVDEAGWEARSVRTHEGVGLSSAILDSTPTARFEREHPQQALEIVGNGKRLWIAGDMRLDARDALITRLGLEAEAKQWSHGRLVLEAYAQWGDEAPRELKGDFAFVIWDEMRGRLFGARDRFGVRPFYFAFVPGQVFAFANEPKALWPALPFGPRPNEAHIARCLASDFSSFTETFYEGVERLPPARTLVLKMIPAASPVQSVYFELDGTYEATLGADAAVTQLRTTFETSVRERAQVSGRLATFLSGGLDSSSVAAVAAREMPEKKPLLALSMVFERFKECDERPWIEKNLEKSGSALEREWVWGDDIGALHDIERVVWHLDGPPPGPNTCSSWAQYAPLQREGIHVVLDGHGGDEVVFLGYQRVNELVYQRRFKAARRELLLLKRHGLSEVSATPLLWAQLSQRARGTRFIGRFARALTNHLNKRAERKARSKRPGEEDEGEEIMRTLLRTEKHSLLPTSTPPTERTVREAHTNTLNGALQSLALESLDALAGSHAVEVRAPFWEENLITFCLSLPSEHKMRDGWNRWIMRRAMEGLLPPEVQWRPGKTNFAPQMIAGFRHIERERVEEQLRNPGALGEWLDVERARVLWDELQTLPLDSARAANITFALWRFVTLGFWLRSLEDRPS